GADSWDELVRSTVIAISHRDDSTRTHYFQTTVQNGDIIGFWVNDARWAQFVVTGKSGTLTTSHGAQYTRFTVRPVSSLPLSPETTGFQFASNATVFFFFTRTDGSGGTVAVPVDDSDFTVTP
ncbi:MAG: hypothetical protein OXE40_11005, partial [Gammaproteobacteria bacterium]|nr:hypothetical protein [Gammaproteobacteria bacterium]